MAAGEASGLRYPCLMRVTVQYLRMLKEFAGWDSATAEVPDGTSLGRLLDELQQRMPQRSQFRGASAMAVNYEYSGSERPLRNDDEVGADSSCQRRQAGRTSLQCDAADADDRARGPGAATHRQCSDPGGGVSRRQWLLPDRGSRANPLGRKVASLDRKRPGQNTLGCTHNWIRGVFDQETRRKPLALAADAVGAVRYGI